MSEPSIIQTPAGALSGNDAKAYVGGRTVFEALRRAFPDIMKPIYASATFQAYRREDLDAALAAARMREEPLTVSA